MKKNFFASVILIALISIVLTACVKESSKNNATLNEPKVENKDEDELDSNVSGVLDEEDIVTNSKEQGNVVIDNAFVNSIGDNSGAKSSEYYIEELISNYEKLFVDANNNGNFSLISNMIIQDSSFYKKQKENVESSYSNNVKYNLLDYNIKEIKEVDNKTYEVYVIEKLQVKENNEENFQDEELNSVYTIKVDGSCMIIANKE